MQSPKRKEELNWKADAGSSQGRIIVDMRRGKSEKNSVGRRGRANVQA